MFTNYNSLYFVCVLQLLCLVGIDNVGNFKNIEIFNA